MTRAYRLVYDTEINGRSVEWVKTAEKLLRPNGDEPLIAYLLREIDRRGGVITLQTVDRDGDMLAVVEPGQRSAFS